MKQHWKSICIIILSALVIGQHIIIARTRQETHWCIAEIRNVMDIAISNKHDAEDCARKLAGGQP